MTQRVKFSCTALLGTNKAGDLKPDADGYYTVVLGALDFFNSAGDFYPFDSAKQMFKESSSLMRRIANGACRAEYGHPKFEPGMTERQFLTRIMSIYEDKVCAHIKEVVVDYTSVKDKDGKPVIAIIGKLRPCGPYGQVLKDSLNNKDENVCFSIRSLTKDVHDGIINRKNIVQIVTWDYVNEPGISVANKYQSPALESVNDDVSSFTLAQLQDVAKGSQKCVGMESAQIALEEVIENLKEPSVKPSKVPPSHNW